MREWAKDMVTHWLLALRANPRAKLDPPRGLLEAWVRAAHRVPELARLRVDCLRRIWKELQAPLRSDRERLAQRLAGGHPLWPRIGDVLLMVDENRGDPSLPFVVHCVFVDGLSTTSHVRSSPIYGPIFGDERVPGFGNYLLGVLVKGAERSAVLQRLLNSQEIFTPCGLIPRDAHALLLDAPALEAVGINFRVPAWWSQRKPPKLGIRVKVGSASPRSSGLRGLLDVHATYLVDDEELSLPEWKRIVDEDINGLVLVRGRWVEVDHAHIRRTIESWRESEALCARGQMTYAEVLDRLESTPDAADVDGPRQEVVAGPWLSERLDAIRTQALRAEVDPGPDFYGVLRPYQREGVGWLSMLLELGFGALLADEMGLGKTVQVIALLLGLLRHRDPGPHLLVVPASLIGNWRTELRTFAPELRFAIEHQGYGSQPTLDSVAVVVTSYSTLLRRPALRERAWGLVALDEAQKIKNASAKMTRALKGVSARMRVALTGTPVENTPGDIWSLMDFLNPGFFGPQAEFLERWRSADDPGQGGRDELRRQLRRVMLRRLKSDPRVAAALPEKVEVMAYCGLTATQAHTYAQVIVSSRGLVTAASGRARDTNRLTMITQLKQVCDHPALYLKDDNFDPTLSAKFLRLRQICEQIAAGGEKALVFTQFQSLTAPLAAFLAGVFGRAGLILDGETPVNQRSRIVAEFQDEQGPPFMILTLKAGGTGLNLTAASHVIHFDLWWNPAAEAQATDRAHRIGQTRRVMVHRLVCRGTLEQGIDRVLRSKRAVAEDLLASEDEDLHITRMDDVEFMKFVDLDQERADGAEDDDL